MLLQDEKVSWISLDFDFNNHEKLALPIIGLSAILVFFKDKVL